MEQLRIVQSKNHRDPMLCPDPGNETRWNSRQDETRRANEIMGDVCEAFSQLLSEGGDDYGLLDAREKTSGNIDRHTYTDEDKMILRQFEASAIEAKRFSKFTQQRGNSYAYLLLEIQIVLQRSSSDTVEMYEGMFSFLAEFVD